jgi:hypothetical protein
LEKKVCFVAAAHLKQTFTLAAFEKGIRYGGGAA